MVLSDAEQRANILIKTKSAVAYIEDGLHYANEPYLEMPFGFKTPDELMGIPLLTDCAQQYPRFRNVFKRL